jgi:hypothetical protein
MGVNIKVNIITLMPLTYNRIGSENKHFRRVCILCLGVLLSQPFSSHCLLTIAQYSKCPFNDMFLKVRWLCSGCPWRQVSLPWRQLSLFLSLCLTFTRLCTHDSPLFHVTDLSQRNDVNSFYSSIKEKIFPCLICCPVEALLPRYWEDVTSS